MLLKMHGALTVPSLSQQLGITGEAVRQQLSRLAKEGLVTATSSPSGVGRPLQRWSLTPAAQTRFPDTHASLTVKLLDIIRKNLGEAALDSIVAEREDETRAAYQAAMSGCHSLQSRVAMLAEMRSSEGYMASWQKNADGSFTLIENHCPICAAATACQGFCRAELQVFRTVLGPSAFVERREHIVGGGRRCSYVVRDASRHARGSRKSSSEPTSR